MITASVAVVDPLGSEVTDANSDLLIDSMSPSCCSSRFAAPFKVVSVSENDQLIHSETNEFIAIQQTVIEGENFDRTPKRRKNDFFGSETESNRPTKLNRNWLVCWLSDN